MSPRAKIAQITNGVGNTQYTIAKSTVATREPNVTEMPSTTATIVTAINSHARLNWKRGSEMSGRDDRVFGVGSDLGMIRFGCAVIFDQAAESYHDHRASG
jgi:hypothetical protein